MPDQIRPERKTQNRVVARLTAAASAGGLAYTYLGDWSKREGNRGIEDEALRDSLRRRGYAEAQIAQALQKLLAAADATGITPYQANLRTYQLLRYGVPVQVAPGAPHETVHLGGLKIQVQHRLRISPSPRPALPRAFSSRGFGGGGR